MNIPFTSVLQDTDGTMTTSGGKNWPDDETLVAYADGRLGDAMAKRVEQFLQTDDEARQFVEMLKASGEMARVAFDEALHAPTSDERLKRLIMAGIPDGGSSVAPDKVVPFQTGRRTSSPPRLALPLAACLALIIGGLAGYQLGQRQFGVTAVSDAINLAIGPVGTGSPYYELLETKPSGVSYSVDSGTAGKLELIVLSTFREGSERLCREFEVIARSPDISPATSAIACRRTGGEWTVHGAVQSAAAQGSGEDFRPAGSEETAAIEGILKSIGAKPALSKADEDALLRNGWK